jgi:hypothetical protein
MVYTPDVEEKHVEARHKKDAAGGNGKKRAAAPVKGNKMMMEAKNATTNPASRTRASAKKVGAQKKVPVDFVEDANRNLWRWCRVWQLPIRPVTLFH